jgi:hypothetical protein
MQCQEDMSVGGDFRRFTGENTTARLLTHNIARPCIAEAAIAASCLPARAGLGRAQF